MQNQQLIWGEIASRLRAVRNGTRLHLEPEHAQALMEPEFYKLIAAAGAEHPMKAILATAFVAAVTISPALAQEVPSQRPAAEAKQAPPKPDSGGTDARGCHTNQKIGEYHCHSRSRGRGSAR